MQVNTVREQPCIGWDLKLYPGAVNQAYWDESADRLLQSDRQVASYFMLAVAVMTIPQLTTAQWPTLALLSAWSLALVWVLLLQLPKLYGRYRGYLLTALRLLIAVASTKTSSWCLQAQGYAAGTVRDSSMTSTLLVQLLLATNTVHIPLLAVRLPLSILLQLLLTATQPLLLLWAGITRDLAACTSSGEAQEALSRLIAGWAMLVESGSYMPVRDSTRLEGRSSSMLVTLCAMYTTTIALTMYCCYIILWSDMLCWLRQKAKTAFEDPGATLGSGVVDIQGVRLQKQELLAMRNTPAAIVLFNRTGFKGQLSRACIHISIVNIVCLACFLCSQGFAQKFLPRLLPDTALDCCYPATPSA